MNSIHFDRQSSLFEEKIEVLQGRTGLQLFQKRLFVKWFRAANQNREQFAESLSTYMQRLGNSQRTCLPLKISSLQYNKRQLNRIYYLVIRAFDEIFERRESYFQWIDHLYDGKLISAGSALRIQALLYRALPYILTCPERNSSEELASSVSSDCSNGILFSWLEYSVRKILRKVRLPSIPLAKQEIDFLLQVSWAITKINRVYQRELCIDFLSNLFLYLQNRSVDSRVLLKKFDVYQYWILRMYDERLGLRHLFAYALDGLQDHGFLEIAALNPILDLFEKSKSWDRFGRRERFIRGLEKLQENERLSFDLKLIGQIFLVTSF